MTVRRRAAVLVVVLALFASLVAACSGGSPHHRDCRTLCTGTIDGARYVIRTPARWNGTLLVYSHGYAQVGTRPPTYLSQIDVAGRGTDAVSTALLAKGYALAASAYRSNGWAVADAVSDDDRLYDRVVDTIGRPKRTIVWGSSMGGLITELLSERESWVSGAVVLCGVVAGPLDNADNMARAMILTSRLTGIDLTLTGRRTAAQIAATSAEVGQALDALAADRTGRSAQLLALSALLGLPGPSINYGVDTIGERLLAAAQNVSQYVGLGLAALDDLTHRYGAGFTAPDFARADLGLSPLLSTGVTALGGDATTIQDVVRATPEPTTSQTARTKVRDSGTPTGRLRVPLLTVHGEADQLVILANEGVLRQRVAAAGESARLRQAAVKIQPGQTPDFVGHCAFSAQQQIGAITAVDGWVASGRAPTSAELRSDLGAGVDPGYTPPAWPVR